MWIELHDSSRDHPKIIKLSRLLTVKKVHIFGHVCSLWTWALRMAPDGNLSSFDKEDIEIGAEWDGESGLFFDGCVSVKLIEMDDDGNYSIHDWHIYARHLKAAEWKRKERERKKCRLTSGDISGRQLTSDDKAGIPGLSPRPTRPDQTRPDQTHQNDLSIGVDELISDVVDIHNPIRDIIEHFKKYAPKTRGGKTLQGPINQRLKDGYTINDLCSVIDKAQRDKWHKETGKRYDLKYLMREDSVTRFLAIGKTDEAANTKIVGHMPYNDDFDWGENGQIKL